MWNPSCVYINDAAYGSVAVEEGARPFEDFNTIGRKRL